MFQCLDVVSGLYRDSCADFCIQLVDVGELPVFKRSRFGTSLSFAVKLLIGEVISATATLVIAMLVVTFTLPYIKAYVPLKGAARG